MSRPPTQRGLQPTFPKIRTINQFRHRQLPWLPDVMMPLRNSRSPIGTTTTITFQLQS